jgi:hypothetical protein
MAGFGPAVVASISLLSPHEGGPSPGFLCAFETAGTPFLPDTDTTPVSSGIRKSVCKRDRWSW